MKQTNKQTILDSVLLNYNNLMI